MRAEVIQLFCNLGNQFGHPTSRLAAAIFRQDDKDLVELAPQHYSCNLASLIFPLPGIEGDSASGSYPRSRTSACTFGCLPAIPEHDR